MANDIVHYANSALLQLLHIAHNYASFVSKGEVWTKEGTLDHLFFQKSSRADSLSFIFEKETLDLVANDIVHYANSALLQLLHIAHRSCPKVNFYC